MKVKKYVLHFILTILSIATCLPGDCRAQVSQPYLCASAAVVTPNFNFGTASTFYNNTNNSFGKIGYADIGFGATLGITALFDSIPFGLSIVAKYNDNPLDINSYVAQVNTVPQNHYRAVNGTGYQQISLIGGFLFEPNGLRSAINLKLLAGVLLCYAPFAEDSGFTTTYVWPMQPNGPAKVLQTHAFAAAFGFGADARLPISKRLFFLATVDFILTEPLFNTTVETTFLNKQTDKYVVQSAPYQYQILMTTLSLNLGLCYKL